MCYWQEHAWFEWEKQDLQLPGWRRRMTDVYRNNWWLGSVLSEPDQSQSDASTLFLAPDSPLLLTAVWHYALWQMTQCGTTWQMIWSEIVACTSSWQLVYHAQLKLFVLVALMTAAPVPYSMNEILSSWLFACREKYKNWSAFVEINYRKSNFATILCTFITVAYMYIC